MPENHPNVIPEPGLPHGNEVFLPSNFRNCSACDSADPLSSRKFTRGENKDLELVNHHIVYEVSSLGEVNAERALNVIAAAPIPGEGCVVIAQKGAVSSVYAAAECP